METVTDFILGGSKITVDGLQPGNWKMLASWKISYDQPRQHIKKQWHYVANKGLSSQSYGFSSSHVWMWELGHKEGWAPKNWYFWAVLLEKTLESPLDCKEIKSVNPKGNQSWIFIGRTDTEAEAPILWPPDAKNWLLGKDPDAEKDWRQEEKGTTEDEMVGWHHQLDGHEFEQAPGVGDGQESLMWYSSWGRQELDMTEWLNRTELSWTANVPFFSIEFFVTFLLMMHLSVNYLLPGKVTHIWPRNTLGDFPVGILWGCNIDTVRMSLVSMKHLMCTFCF